MDQFTETAEVGNIRQVCQRSADGMDVEEYREDEDQKSLKRRREPLSDGEQNVPSSPPEALGKMKRRCLEPTGVENVKPLEQWAGSPTRPRLRWAEQVVKPDTPAISSIQSRLRLLNQRQEGTAPLAQRCLSDPGRDGLSGCDSQLDAEGCRAELRLIGDAEFRSRVERFELRPAGDGPSLSTPRPRVLSTFARTIQEKLQSADTPSTSRAERIRREREQELHLLRSQPISDNAWLKRSWSDPSLAEAEPGVQVEDAEKSDGWSELEYSGTVETSAPSEENLSFSQEPHLQVKSTGEHEEANSQTGESPPGKECPAAERQEEAGTPSCGHQEEAGAPSAYRELGSSDSEHKEELGSPKRQQEEEGIPSREQQEDAESSSDEPQEELGSPKGEDENKLEPPNGQQEEEGTSAARHQEEGESDSGDCGEEFGSPGGEHKKEVGPQKRQKEEGDSPSCEQQKEEESPANNQEEARSSDDLREEENSSGGEQENAGLPGERQEELRLPDKEEEEAGFLGEHQGQMAPSLSEEQDPGHSPEELQELNKVTFVMEPKMTGESAASEVGPEDSWRKQSMLEAELATQEEMNTSEMIDQMFEGVLDTTDEEDGAEEEEGKGRGEEPEEKEQEKEKTKTEEEVVEEEEEEESKELDTSMEELLSVPPSCILSPLSKSLEAVITPMRLASSQLIDPPSLLLTPEEVTTPPVDSSPLYSIDAYRTHWQKSRRATQSVTPVVCRRAVERSRPQPSVNSKERITLLNEEAARLQGVITQTLQALSCCTDEGHGKGSLEEAEAEKLLLVSCEKRSALLAEVSRLREGNMGQAGVCDRDSDIQSLEPCRGMVTINNVQLPLKVEFVCPARTRSGQPTHYFFVLIRYGACNIVATPLATAADAQNGDTISFPTSITLQDIRANFQIDVEVYSLSRSQGNNLNMERRTTKYKVTPKKLLNTITRFNHSITSATLPSMNSRRSSNFSLVGSHKITLASLGQTKFPLDKVPFLSPLEGNIYLRLECESHSHVQHRGFLTMFEDVSGFGAWHRRWFCLEGSHLSYWNYPNDEHSRTPEGSISLAGCNTWCVRPVKRDSCARPHTFELVSTRTLQQDHHHTLEKRWFSADTREERAEWMEKLNQTLLDLHTWKPRPVTSDPQSCGPSRESML